MAEWREEGNARRGVRDNSWEGWARRIVSMCVDEERAGRFNRERLVSDGLQILDPDTIGEWSCGHRPAKLAAASRTPKSRRHGGGSMVGGSARWGGGGSSS
jgi:hypothetical protein